MPLNRDTVSENYLKRVYTETLNAMHGLMEESRFSENWVRTGTENPNVEAEAVRRVLHARYGGRVVTWSSNVQSNIAAADAGYQVINTRSISRNELRNLRGLGGLKSASELFPMEMDESHTEDVITDNEIMIEFQRWVVEVGRMAGKQVVPAFINNPRSRMLADCTMNTGNPVMRFNTHRLGAEFFAGRGTEQLELVIHELGHTGMNRAMSHGPAWGQACARMGTMIALAMGKS